MKRAIERSQKAFQDTIGSDLGPSGARNAKGYRQAMTRSYYEGYGSELPGLRGGDAPERKGTPKREQLPRPRQLAFAKSKTPPSNKNLVRSTKKK